MHVAWWAPMHHFLSVCLYVCLSVCLGIRLGPYWLVRLSKVPVLASFLLLAVANSSTVSMCSECSCWLVFARLLVGFFTRSCLRKCMSHVSFNLYLIYL